MKFHKHALVAILITLAILVISVTPVVAADIQTAYAKISEDLLSAFDEKGNGERMNVLVWITDNATEKYQTTIQNLDSPTSIQQDEYDIYNLQSNTNSELTEEERMLRVAEIQNYIMQKRQIAQAIYLEANNAIADTISDEISGGKIVYISKYSPFIICNITKSEAVNLASNNNILSLTNGEIKGENSSASAKITIGADIVESNGYSGQGVKLGMIESGMPDKTLSCFSGLSSKIIKKSTSNQQTALEIDHASQVAAIMVGAETGVARNFDTLYTASTQSIAEMYENIEWMLENGVNVINMSWAPKKECNYTILTYWMEHIAYNHSAHIVIASGNDGADHVADIGMAYNVITVGAVDDNNTPNNHRDDEIYTANNMSLYGSAYNSSKTTLANKPDLCAPGVDIAIETNANTISSNTGTSFAAPYVSASIAILCSFNPDLLTAQDLMKAILCSSVIQQTDHDYATIDTGYTKYGAGMLNVKNARTVVAMQYYASSTISSGQTKTYYLGRFSEGQTISVSMSYLRRVRFAEGDDHEIAANIIQNPLSNLDIYICKKSEADIDNPDASSISTRNNVEKIIHTFDATDEYVVIVKRHSDNNSYATYFGVSWLIHTTGMQ